MSYLNKILSVEDAFKQRSLLQKTGKIVVFTNGCFDLIHKGHISYLEEARAMGDVLIVGLNSDASIERIKGDGRPVKAIDSRAAVLAGLASVDIVVVFEEDTPLDLIMRLKPDVLVKGGDYTIDKIVGADDVTAYGGKVTTIEFLPGYSSSQIIQKIVKGQ